MKMMAIDGNSLINRAFYAVRLLTNKSGMYTNAVYGFMNMLLKLIEEEQPERICVCFDMRAKTFRHLKYEGYKAQRKGMPEELACQMPILKRILDLMGIARMEKEGYEADDLLGTLARRCHENGEECVIVTGDRDSLQFISQGAVVKLVITRMGQTTYKNFDAAAFAEEYEGLTPDKIVDLKALMGDKSDNIPGVAGIGEKTALQLVTRFGSLEGVYENIESDAITASVRKKLLADRENAFMSYDLALGDVEAPIDDVSLEQLKRGETDETGLYEEFSTLEFSSLIKRMGLTPGLSAEKTAEEAFQPDGSYQQVTNREELDLLKQRMQAAKQVFCLIPAHLAAAALRVEGKTYYLAQSDFDMETYDGFLAALFSEKVQKIFHDAKPVFCALMERGIAEPKGLFYDTALCCYLLDPTANGYDLEKMARDRLGVLLPPAEEYQKEEAFSPLAGLSEAAKVMAEHVSAIEALYWKVALQLTEDGMEDLLKRVELPLVTVLADMQCRGFLIDQQRLNEFGAVLEQRLGTLTEQIYEYAGERFNLNSTKQLGVILFEKLGLRVIKKTKSGYSTDIEVLEKLRGSHEIIDCMIEYRKTSKLKSTYVDGLNKVIGADGRIHSTFQQMVTATGRLSSTEPNLQNIPIRQELGSEIRRCFVPAPGCVLIDADYSQIELRILAHIAEDPIMQNAFRTGEDIHAVTASQVFGVPLEMVTHAMRSHAKAVNFGIVYGISAFSLSEDIHVSPKEAQGYIDSYLEKYHSVRNYMERIKAQAKNDGYVTTLWGRRRYLPELQSKNFNLRSFGERVALNTPIQGTAADVIKAAMVAVYERLQREHFRAKLLLQVHDELIIEAPKEEAEQVSRLLVEEMERAISLSVTLVAEVSMGENWYDAKK